ncbi:MAG: DegT/DnrJ/EryC1/StrS family aminotransferase [Campylobacterales bacterium]|nr:DegT/DnrJ/EryC1/StrS family aminotransferase [Campylobacterales bacterium]
MINVTSTHLPNIKKYQKYVEQIFASKKVTNYGPLVRELEEKLRDYLGVKNVVLVANGTVALEIAYRTLDLKGFAITTPFSFVATTSSLVTNGLLPIFADIDPKTLNINPQNIEELISPNTSAIVATHVFGNPCDIEAMEAIAKKHKLKLIYDGAHTFGATYKGENIASYGDITTLSFHATKLFHTIEGGALIINDDALAQKARYLINFGIENTESIPHLGTNAKMNEFEAAMGLCVLDELGTIFDARKKVYERYLQELEGFVEFQLRDKETTPNYNYMPVLFESEEQLLRVQKALNKEDIFPRRYFYPSLDTLSYIEPKQCMPISRDISRRILCLPIYVELSLEMQTQIIEIVKDNI